jgi:hypothetical protein
MVLAKYHPRFVFVGLGHLLEHLLVSNARHIQLANAFGIKKIMRNMLALQQSIRTITNKAQSMEFERAKRYYSLFFVTPSVSLVSSDSYFELIFAVSGNVGWCSKGAVVQLRRIQNNA